MDKNQDNARMGTRSGLDPAEGTYPGAHFTMGRGFVKIHRSLIGWEWYNDERLKSVFLHILLRCNWQDRRWMGRDVPSGTLITSSINLAEELNLSRSALNRALKRLQKSGEISVKADNKWTAITLTNWAKYQGEGDEAGQPADNERTANGQRADTTKESKETKKEKKERKEEARSVEDRKREFLDRCREAVTEAPERLPQPLRQGFADYWTELDAKGERMRFEDQKYFDVSRRMVTWKQRAIASGDIKDTAPKGNWNPRA